MRRIGHTASGSLLVEMSEAEYAGLAGSPRPEREAIDLAAMRNGPTIVFDPYDIRIWLDNFRHDFNRLGLSTRMRNIFLRQICDPLEVGWEAAIELDKEASRKRGLGELFWYRYRYENILNLVTQNRQLLSFDDWIEVVPQRKTKLQHLWNVGDKSIDELLTAAQRLRAERILAS